MPTSSVCATRASNTQHCPLTDRFRCVPARAGGRTWWAHLEFAPMNITPTILPKKIEEILESSRSYPYSLNSFDFGVFRSVSGTKSLSKSRDDPRVGGAGGRTFQA